MAKLNIEPHKALLWTKNMAPHSIFYTEDNSNKNRDYYRFAYSELERMIHQYQEWILRDYTDQLLLITMKSKMMFGKTSNINNLLAKIWIAYMDHRNIILSCEIASSESVVVIYEVTLMAVNAFNGKQVSIPSSIIDEFVADFDSVIFNREKDRKKVVNIKI